MTSGGRGWLEMKGGDVSKIQPMAWPNAGGINNGGKGLSPRLFALQTAAFRSVFGNSDSRKLKAGSGAFACYLPRMVR